MVVVATWRRMSLARWRTARWVMMSSWRRTACLIVMVGIWRTPSWGRRRRPTHPILVGWRWVIGWRWTGVGGSTRSGKTWGWGRGEMGAGCLSPWVTHWLGNNWADGWDPWRRWGEAGEEGRGRGGRSRGWDTMSKTQGSIGGVLRSGVLGSDQTMVQWRAVGSVTPHSTGTGITWLCTSCGSGVKGGISDPWGPGELHISVHRSGLLLRGVGVMRGWIGVVGWWWTRTESKGTCQGTLLGVTLSGPWGRRRMRAWRGRFGSSTFIPRKSAVGVEDWGLIPSGGIRGGSMG